MGKYIKKGKITGDVTVMEFSHQSSIGVRTRARALALQRQQRASSPTPAPSPSVGNEDVSYIQLRSRRLEKPPVFSPRGKERESFKNACNPWNAQKTSSKILPECSSTKYCAKQTNGSFEEHAAEFESANGGARGTSPCSSFVRNADAGTNTDCTARRMPKPNPRPRDSQLDELFTAAEHSQQQLLVEKYNFDPVNDCPLPGRYEWVSLDP